MALAPALAQKVVLSFGALKLKSKDLLSKSDPFLKLYIKHPAAKKEEIFKTEAIQNNENPKWSANCELTYMFEVNQQYIVEIYDHDTNSDNDIIGSAEFTLGNVMASGSSRIPLTKRGKTKPSKKMAVVVTGSALAVSKLFANIDIRVKDLKKSSIFANFDKDDSYAEFIAQQPDGSELVVHRTPTVYDTQKPDYPPFACSLGKLVHGNPANKFTLRIMRVKSNGEVECMGDNKNLCPNDLIVLPGQKEKKVDLFNSKGKDICDVFFEKFEIFEKHSFMDYLQGGLDFGLTVAIDFTGSNGDPRTQSSLHYIDPTGQKRNQYIDGLRSIGNVLAAYAQKQYVPALGYGGFASIDGQPAVTSHCFPLSLSSQHPYFDGIESVVQGYCNAVAQVQLSGPTYFGQIINSATVTAARPYAPNYQHFNILLILTDGIINDMDQTIDAIVAASDKPLCIIIVGVGTANFKEMEKLDGDDHCLKSRTLGAAKNDIVQFVEMSKYIHDPARLAEATLKEVPACVERFMALHKIAPLVRQPVVFQ